MLHWVRACILIAMLPTFQAINNTFKYSIKSIHESQKCSEYPIPSIQAKQYRKTQKNSKITQRNIYMSSISSIYGLKICTSIILIHISKFRRNNSCILERFIFDHVQCVAIFLVRQSIGNSACPSIYIFCSTYRSLPDQSYHPARMRDLCLHDLFIQPVKVISKFMQAI